MYEHTENVRLAGKTYKIRCDINVLAEIQEQLGSLQEFELNIAGLRIAENPDGTIMRDENNKIVFKRVDPSLKTIRDFLPMMLKEGNPDTDIQDAIDAVMAAKFDLYEVSVQMHKEYSKCFERKNPSSSKRKQRKQIAK